MPDNDIFISWSRPDAQKIAGELKNHFQVVLGAEAFYSEEDIPPGAVWEPKIQEQLENSKYGVIVLMPSNLLEPWLFYEGGGIRYGNKHCFPLLFGMTDDKLPGPFKALNAKTFNKETVKALDKSINEATGNKVDGKVLDRRFEYDWPRLEKAVNDVLAHEQVSPRIVMKESLPQLPPTLEILRHRWESTGHSDFKLYTFCGLDPSQVLDHVEPNYDLEVVYYLWADAETGDSISVHQQREPADETDAQGRQYLRVSIDYNGGLFAPNVAIRPAGQSLLKTNLPGGFKLLSFEARIPSDESIDGAYPVQLGLRIIDGFKTHWRYRKHEDMRWFDVTDVGVWKRLELSLQWDPRFWDKFEYDGNYWYVGDRPEFSTILAVVILVRRFSVKGKSPVPEPGKAVVDIRNWKVS